MRNKTLPIGSSGCAAAYAGVLFTTSFASCDDILNGLDSRDVLTLK